LYKSNEQVVQVGRKSDNSIQFRDECRMRALHAIPRKCALERRAGSGSNGVHPISPSPEIDMVSQVPSVSAQLRYLAPSSEQPYSYTFAPPQGRQWQGGAGVAHMVDIHDIRSAGAPFSLAQAGFELWRIPSQVTNFHDRLEVKAVYYPEIAARLVAATGARHAFVFDHLVRTQAPGPLAPTFGQQPDGGMPGAAGMVHCDFTARSAANRLRAMQEEGGGESGAGRFCLVNLWRPIGQSVLTAPLAVCDARSVEPSDLVPMTIHYPSRTGELHVARYSPAHRWWYASEMQPDETLVFMQYDAAGGRSQVLHTAFENPLAPPGASARTSIEARCLLVFGGA
jgi:hypothetical protein